MPAVLLLFLAVSAVPGASSGPGTCLVPPAVGLRGRLVVASGRNFEGAIVTLTKDVATVDRGGRKLVDVARDRLLGLVPSGCLAPKAPFEALDARGGSAARVILLDGSSLVGWPSTEAPNLLTLDVAGERRELDWSTIAVVIPVVRRPRPIGLVERHLEAPSAQMVRPGALHLALSGNTHLSATYGIAPWFSASLGSILPVFQASALPANWDGGVDAGLTVLGALHLKGGLRAWGSSSGATSGAVSATATWSAATLDLTLHAGPRFRSLGTALPFHEDVGLALAATWRPTPRFAIISENWANYYLEPSLHALAARLDWERFAFDVGLAATSRAALYPWLGVTMELSP